MPQPKKKTSHSKQGNRRHHWKATLPSLVKCKNCGEEKFAHKVCGLCGFYNGMAVSVSKGD